MHFFSAAITQELFEQLLSGRSEVYTCPISDDLGYCGFIVVKPLPQTVIGRTCLKAVGVSTQEAFFPPMTDCVANLFGMNLAVKSLPFQEQDREVAACATSALWSTLYATARTYQHVILSPLQITRIAISTLPTLSRSLPNDGLTVDHMVGVIRHLDLEIDLIDISDNPTIPFHAYAYAYLRAGVPLLLSFDFSPLEGPARDSRAHAVSVVGYDPGTEDLVPTEETGFLLRATGINQLYVHDDRVGPFSPITLDRNTPGTVVTSWKDADGNKIPAYLDQLLIPLYPQIRTPFAPILLAIMEFDEIIEHFRATNGIPLHARLEWDVHLTQLDALRRAVLNDTHIPSEEKRDIVTQSLPRFLWRATGYLDDLPKIDLLFDATDLRQGKQFVRTISYDRSLELTIAGELAEVQENTIKLDLTENIIEKMRSMRSESQRRQEV